MADTTNGNLETAAEQEEREMTAEEIAQITDFRNTPWQGPIAERKYQVERAFDRRVSTIEQLLVEASECTDAKEAAALTTVAVRRIRALRQDALVYRGLNINRIDVLGETR